MFEFCVQLEVIIYRNRYQYYRKWIMHVHNIFGLLVTASFQAVFAGMEAQCPPWFVLNNSSGFCYFPQCICGRYIPFMIECVQEEYTSYLMLGHCAFHISNSNDTMAAPCPYVFPEHLFDGFTLHLPQSVDAIHLY